MGWGPAWGPAGRKEPPAPAGPGNSARGARLGAHLPVVRAHTHANLARTGGPAVRAAAAGRLGGPQTPPHHTTPTPGRDAGADAAQRVQGRHLPGQRQGAGGALRAAAGRPGRGAPGLPACPPSCLLTCLPARQPAACLRCPPACPPARLCACLPACLPACLLACLLAWPAGLTPACLGAACCGWRRARRRVRRRPGPASRTRPAGACHPPPPTPPNSPPHPPPLSRHAGPRPGGGEVGSAGPRRVCKRGRLRECPRLGRTLGIVARLVSPSVRGAWCRPRPAPRVDTAKHRPGMSPPCSPVRWASNPVPPHPALGPSPQGGGYGELHLRLTYWPFELLSGHVKCRLGTLLITLHRCGGKRGWWWWWWWVWGGCGCGCGGGARGSSALPCLALPGGPGQVPFAQPPHPRPPTPPPTPPHPVTPQLRRPAARRPAHRLLRSVCGVPSGQGKLGSRYAQGCRAARSAGTGAPLLLTALHMVEPVGVSPARLAPGGTGAPLQALGAAGVRLPRAFCPAPARPRTPMRVRHASLPDHAAVCPSPPTRAPFPLQCLQEMRKSPVQYSNLNPKWQDTKFDFFKARPGV